jgi:hypothetical protein
VHQDWVLRSVEVSRSVEEWNKLAQSELEQIAAYGEDADRAAINAPGWRKNPHDSLAVVPGPSSKNYVRSSVISRA